MTEIKLEMTRLAYELAKEVFHERISRQEALDKLEADVKMNRGSASDYIVNFQKMWKGVKYTRTFNTEATDYILKNIFADYGIERYKKAITSVREHIAYYEGLGRGNLNSIRVVLARHERQLLSTHTSLYPNEIEQSSDIHEGAKKRVIVNSYERNSEARNQCIAHYDKSCVVCGFNFEEKYGELGIGFIHVHHLVPLAKIGQEYKVDPIKDLRPVCPNCHAMLHRKSPPFSIEELKLKIHNKSLHSNPK